MQIKFIKVTIFHEKFTRKQEEIQANNERRKVEAFLNSELPRSFSEAVIQRCSVKIVFIEISQNSQENTCARVSF